MGKKEKKRMNIKSRSRFTVKLMKLKFQDPSTAWVLEGVLAMCSSDLL